MFVDQYYKPNFIDNFNLVRFINTKAVAKYLWKLKYELVFSLHFPFDPSIKVVLNNNLGQKKLSP